MPKLGWTGAALQAGAEDLGFPATLGSIVAQPDIGLVHHQFKAANERLELGMQKQVKTFFLSGGWSFDWIHKKPNCLK